MMPEIMFNGPGGRIEGRYHHNEDPESKIVLILHPHPKFGGTMNNPITYNVYYTFVQRGFSVLRFNFRGVGKSQGEYDSGIGELSDAASALDWIQALNKDSNGCWVVGFSFGAWIAMQLLMRRPEIESFISISPPANLYDFNFLAPCPSSGLIVNGSEDTVAPKSDISKLVDRLQAQKGIKVNHSLVDGANHFFDNKIKELNSQIGSYLDSIISS
tara:strand:- start:2275 stop:2919 length:645 start_codon:yes stop_codon:yes gene_type:complete